MHAHVGTTLVLAACAVAIPAWAQVRIPSGLEPGQVQQQLRQMRTPQTVEPQMLPPVPEQTAPAAASDIRFILRGLNIEGVTRYTREELAAAFAPLLGREISVAQVFQIANDQTARYRRDGFILSQVLVPAQDITDGHVRLISVEGYIDDVEFRGELPDNQQTRLRTYANELKRIRPLTAATLERYLLLMNDLGQTTARGTLVPSAQLQGAANLIVDFARERMHVTVATDSRNTRSLGPQRLTADLDAYGILGTWDHLGLHSGSTLDDELNYLGLSYGSVVGSNGMQWNVSATGVRARPGPAANLTALDFETESVASALQVRYPLVRSRTRNLYIRTALTSFDGQTELSLARLSDDRIRTIRAGFTFDYADRWRGINMLDLELAHGLNGFGARKTGTTATPLSRANGKVDFSKVALYAARLQSLGGRWSALFAVQSQQAFDTLLSPELFAFGGELFGRGYDAAELVGDSGEAAKFELRYMGRLPGRLPAYSFYGFYDWGRVRRRDALNEPAQEHASSAGAGARFTSNGGRWQGFVEIAAPLDRDVAAEGDRDARIFLGLQFTP